MREMKPEDSDTYQCGVERIGLDDMQDFQVTVLQAAHSSLQDFSKIFEGLHPNFVHQSHFQKYPQNSSSLLVYRDDTGDAPQAQKPTRQHRTIGQGDTTVFGLRLQPRDRSRDDTGDAPQALKPMWKCRTIGQGDITGFKLRLCLDTSRDDKGVCTKSAPWVDMVDFPSTFKDLQEKGLVEVSCQQQFENKTFWTQHARVRTHPAGKCRKNTDWGPNLTVSPERDYYNQGDEVTVLCPPEYRPNHNTIRCIQSENKNSWNVSDVFCTELRPIPVPPTTMPRAEFSLWSSLVVSVTFGLLPPLAVKLLTLLVVIGVAFLTNIRRRNKSTKQGVKSEGQLEQENINVFLKKAKGSKISETELAEEDHQTTYGNQEQLPKAKGSKIPKTKLAEEDHQTIYENPEQLLSCNLYRQPFKVV
ncbi:uncharacterized protein LOC142462825 [Ascaphus truei]|uniref:uncharacterized protein LOC142462825 n=1 Tax=Ascaphus truei TaxID=8439 RepID=UPI003F5AA6D1